MDFNLGGLTTGDALVDFALQIVCGLYLLLCLAQLFVPKDSRFGARLAAMNVVLRSAKKVASKTKTPAKKASRLNGTIALVGSLLFVACRPIGETKLGSIDWPALVRCGPDIEDIIGAVSEILLNGSKVSEQLGSLARTHGPDAVVCAVDRLRADWSSPGAASSSARVEALGRADVWFDEVGSEVVK